MMGNLPLRSFVLVFMYYYDAVVSQTVSLYRRAEHVPFQAKFIVSDIEVPTSPM